MDQVRFTILGSGTSAGVPIIACDCEVCQSDDPRDQRTRPGACLEFRDDTGQDRTILIDTSPDLRQQVLRHRIQRCDAILFTHHHVDHIFGLDEVRRFNAVMRAPINVYAEPKTLEALHRVYQHIFDAQNNTNDSFVATLIAHPLNVEEPIELFGLRITPIRFLHGRLPILGFRIERSCAQRRAASASADDQGNDEGGHVQAQDPLPLAYCTDVSAIPPETWPMLTNLQTLIIDALRYRHHPTHFNIDQAVDAALEIKADQTYFIHMTHDVGHARLDAELPEGIGPAYDGLTLGTPQRRER